MFLIRADGNAKIGAGHIMRCLSVAAAAGRMNSAPDILFVCADEESAAFVRDRGFSATALGTDGRDLLSELPAWKRLISELAAAGICSDQPVIGACPDQTEEPVILVDSYFATDDYLKELRAYGKVCLMDDLQRHCYPVDVLINYNIYAEHARYEALYAGTETQLLLGGVYAPLREQFCGAAYSPAEEVRNVLITTGGGDADNIAETVLRAVYRPEFIYHVLVGRFSPHLERWKKLAGAERNIRVHCDVLDMAGLIAECDLAITAGGSTVYELSAVGVPFICFSFAENQEALARYFGEREIAGYAGAWHLDQPAAVEELKWLFERFCADKDLRERCFRAERTLVDGQGAKRLAEALLDG